MRVNFFWFRRDLRLDDNVGLFEALRSPEPVLAFYIFTPEALANLEPGNLKINFIYDQVMQLKQKLQQQGSDLLIFFGEPEKVIRELIQEHDVSSVFANSVYEPNAVLQDSMVERLLKEKSIAFVRLKDQVAFEKSEIVTGQGNPYKVFTSYYKNWRQKLKPAQFSSVPSESHLDGLLHYKKPSSAPTLESLGFRGGSLFYPTMRITPQFLKSYSKTRDRLEEPSTSRASLYLCHGVLSPRKALRLGIKYSEEWLRQLAWREFFIQILYHYPQVIHESYKPEFDRVAWQEPGHEFDLWKAGQTGYPLVDAGMRQLRATGFLPNRVRMVVASFLCKHLLIHWRFGERYFAEMLLDHDLALNNGNWQWVAGTGVDAAPYFRIFNPEAQAKKFDPDSRYIRRWIPEYETSQYPAPIVDHKAARERALRAFKARH